MRSADVVEQTDASECDGCGHLETDPTPPICPACGLEMRHIGRLRDR